MSFSFGKKAAVSDEPTWVCDRRLCLTEDRSRVVEENTAEARFLWAVPGQEVDRAEAVRLGAIRSKETVELPADPPKRKPGRPPSAKRTVPDENK